MTATLTQARDEILDVFVTAWLADANTMNVPILYWDVKDDPPAAPNPYVRVNVQHNSTGGQATLQGEVGSRRYRRFGQAIAAIWAPIGDGLQDADTYATVARDAFEGTVTSPGNVIFRDVNVVEVGPDGGRFRVNVLAEFEYDEIK